MRSHPDDCQLWIWCSRESTPRRYIKTCANNTYFDPYKIECNHDFIVLDRCLKGPEILTTAGVIDNTTKVMDANVTSAPSMEPPGTTAQIIPETTGLFPSAD